MSKHTPRPWTIQRYTNYHGFAIDAPGRGCIAERWYTAPLDSDGDEEMAANARLIAAAPDLYEALKAAEVWVILGQARDPETTHPQAIQNAKDDHAKLRAAIAKAEGK